MYGHGHVHCVFSCVCAIAACMIAVCTWCTCNCESGDVRQMALGEVVGDGG